MSSFRHPSCLVTVTMNPCRAEKSSAIGCLDEQLFDGLLDGLDLRLELGALVDGDGAGDHSARHTAGTAKSCNINSKRSALFYDYK